MLATRPTENAVVAEKVFLLPSRVDSLELCDVDAKFQRHLVFLETVLQRSTLHDSEQLQLNLNDEHLFLHRFKPNSTSACGRVEFSEFTFRNGGLCWGLCCVCVVITGL